MGARPPVYWLDTSLEMYALASYLAPLKDCPIPAFRGTLQSASVYKSSGRVAPMRWPALPAASLGGLVRARMLRLGRPGSLGPGMHTSIR